MSLVEKAAWVIERNLGEDLTLGTLAQACGVSRFHLSHAFGQIVGQPVIQYLRDRRLSEAAKRLVREKSGVLDVALEAGYGSNEAFTRAFRTRFGVTPEAVRQRSSLDRLGLVEPLVRSPALPASLEEPRRETSGRLNFIGLAEDHVLGRTAGIPGQWSRFMERFGTIEGVIDPIPWGVAALAQAVLVHKQGRIADRTLQDQEHRASGLNLVGRLPLDRRRSDARFLRQMRHADVLSN